ncbi:hypothetical protein JCM11251_002068 [Rhodosporidiobolus azoricus]
MDPLLSRLESLPVELQLAILQHIPTRPDSTLPFGSLPLSRCSRNLHDLVSPFLYAEVRLTSSQQAQCFLDDSASRHMHYVRRLALLRPNLKSPSWERHTLWTVLRALPNLTELVLDGVADQHTLQRLLRDLPTKERLEQLTCVAQPTTNRADYQVYDPFDALSHASQPSWLELLADFPALQRFRLVNGDLAVAASSASALLFPDGSASTCISFSLPSGLHSIQLEAVNVTDGILRTLLAGGQVEEVALRKCTGFSRAGLVEAFKANGGRLRQLDLVDGGGSSMASSLPPTPLSFPSRSPTLLPSSALPQPSSTSTTPNLLGVLDIILPSLPNLILLGTTGALFSPAILERLHTLTPYLRHLSIAAHPHITPAALLPLVQPCPPGEKGTRLTSLRRLELHRAAPFSPSYACGTSPWSISPSTSESDPSILELCTSARSQDVHLIGEVFERVQERLEWAETEAEKLALGLERMNHRGEEEVPQVRRRKRPGVAQHLVSVPHVRLAHLANGEETPLFHGTASLALHRSTPARSRSVSPQPGRAPPALPPRPGATGPTPPPYTSLPGPSSTSTTHLSPSTSQHEWLVLTLTLAGEGQPAFEMPISLSDTSNSIIASPPHSYILPNLTGVDPSTFFSSSQGDRKRQQAGADNGLIKLSLPSGTGTETVDPETRELFEASLYGLYRGEGSRYDDPTAPPPGAQLYLVDEASGEVLGELATEGGMHLQEDSQLAAGKVDDKPGSTATVGSRISLDGHEPVVIDASEGQVMDPNHPSVTYSVKPVSFYRPAENPQNSGLISAANFLSRGIIVGSEILSRQFETGAGKYVSSRPATTTPMVFKQETKARLAQGNHYTQTATVYSGKAAAAVGNVASKLGDKIGKSTGIQSQPGGPPPTGWRGALASTLTAVSTVADHLEAGGKTLLDSGSKSASQVIHHKYGSEARGVADDVGGSVKHCALVYIDARGVGRKALLKSVGKSALRADMADGSQLYLSNENGELKQIEASAVQGGSVPLALEGRVSGTTTPVYAGSSGSRTPIRASGGGFGSGFGGGKEKGRY